MPITGPQPQPVAPSSGPLYGSLEVPTGPEQDGPPDGLTLDRAIDVTLERSLDLRQKFFEIPMARADILQANLRSNPVFYQDGQLLQYKSLPFSRSRPGGPQQFDTNISYPLDVSHKRQARTMVAARAEKVLERNIRTPSATGSMIFTLPTSRPSGHARRSDTRPKAYRAWRR